MTLDPSVRLLGSLSYRTHIENISKAREPILSRKWGQHRDSSTLLVAMTSNYLQDFPNYGSSSGLLRHPALHLQGISKA